MQAERVIVSLGIDYQIVPVPKEFSSECGMCIEIDCSDSDALLAELQINRISINAVIKVDA